jgi:hypothetical protein
MPSSRMLHHVALVRADISEALSSSETLILTRATPHNIPEDGRHHVCLSSHIRARHSPLPLSSLVLYATTLPNLQPDIKTPILVCKVYIDITQNKALLKFMKENFNLDCVTESSTMLSNTCLDLTLAANVLAKTVSYTSYFSYHRPMYNKHCLQYNTNFHSFNN